MEDMMSQLSRQYNFSFWHKLYADDLVVCVNHNHLETLLETLHNVSHNYDLKINPKKCAIFDVKYL